VECRQLSTVWIYLLSAEISKLLGGKFSTSISFEAGDEGTSFLLHADFEAFESRKCFRFLM